MKTRISLVTVVFILSMLSPAGQAVSGPPQLVAPVETLSERAGANNARFQRVPSMPGREVVLRRDDRYNPYHVAPPERVAWHVQSTNFSINWNPSSCTGSVSAWPQSAKDAFSYAVNIWASQLNASTTIEIDACWRSDLPYGVLGSSGPTVVYPYTPSTWHPIALANALAGSDLNGDTAEIKSNFNSTVDWYFGTDQNPGGQMDFVSVVLHEVAHGLGFTGSMWVDVAGYIYCGSIGQGCWGVESSPPYNPMIYDRFAENGSNQSLLNESLFPNHSLALGAQLTSGNVYFNGANARAANGGGHVKLYAPSSWEPYSSYAHLDTIFDNTPNALMTPSLARGEAIHNPGSITLGIFKDIGWPAGASAPTLTSITPNSGNNTGTVSITNLAGSNFQSGATVKLTRSGQTAINATNVVVVSATLITCSFNLTGAAAGQWNVVVTNPDSQSGTLPNGFTVTRRVAADFDGDGKTDLLVYRPSDGYWYWLTSSSGYSYATYGSRGWGSPGDKPLLGDMDGEGRTDPVVYRPSNGSWLWLTSSSGYSYATYGSKQWGSTGDLPLTGDIDGDGKTDLIVYRPSTGDWIWLTSSSGYAYTSYGVRRWGSTGDVPLPGDMDGDGKTDLIVYRPSTGDWLWLTSSSGYAYTSYGVRRWGSPNDVIVDARQR